MFPVIYKDRIPHTESYPIGAQQISTALADVPQAQMLAIAFGRYGSHLGYVSAWQARGPESNWKHRAVLQISYSRQRPDISTSKLAIKLGVLEPRWHIRVWSAPRRLRHTINLLLAGEGLPRIRNWLVERPRLHGKFTREGMLVLFDEEKEVLSYE